MNKLLSQLLMKSRFHDSMSCFGCRGGTDLGGQPRHRVVLRSMAAISLF